MRQSQRGKCDTAPSSGAPIIGATTAIRLCRPLTAPIVRPCVVASAAPEMMLCIDAATVNPRTLQNTTANIIQPSVAAPQPMYASVDETSPAIARRCGENRFRSRPSSKPCTSADIRPTANSDQPFSCGPQPNLKVAYRTQVV